MISRSSSNAADRLRRAKSSSSAHTSASSHRHSQAHDDASASHEQAEAAAVQAYERARFVDKPAHRPVPPKLQHRRSQANGKSQGSHFEEARRRNFVRAEENTKLRTSTTSRAFGVCHEGPSTSEQHQIITRPSKISSPVSGQDAPAQPNPSSARARLLRERQSDYTDGSPAPRNSQSVKGREALDPMFPVELTEPSVYSNVSTKPTETGLRKWNSTQNSYSTVVNDPASETDRELVAKARDKCLQDFQTKRIRGRKSSFFPSLQKRRTTTTGNNFDTLLPPYNHADDEMPVILPRNTSPPPAEVEEEKKSRNLSGTLKGRFMKVFRRSSKVLGELPAQQVSGRDFHFLVRDDDGSDIVENTAANEGDPFTSVDSGEPNGGFDSVHDIAIRNGDFETTSNDRSRVTSWTDSSMAGMSSIRTKNQSGQLVSQPQPPTLKHRSSSQVLRKASSFFGRPVQNRLRRATKVRVGGSEHSQGLYDALQQHMEPNSHSPMDQNAHPNSSDDGPRLCSQYALASLPSQRRYNASVLSDQTRVPSTIRQVTPNDVATLNVDIPCSINEHESTGSEVNVTHAAFDSEDDPAAGTPRSGLKRRSALRAAPPSQAQLAKRMERAKNRWQSPLGQLSPSGPHSSRANLEENPYEMRSLSRTLQSAAPNNDLPHHARLIRSPEAVRKGALSPSIYSRATDGASPRAATPEGFGMTTITITGHEVRRYSISPSKQENLRRDQSSRDWRRWLSGEMSHFSRGVSSGETRSVTSDDEHPPGTNDVNNEDPFASRPICTSPVLSNRSDDARTVRSRRQSSASAYMNDRYPMIQTSRRTSLQSVSRKTSIEPVIPHLEPGSNRIDRIADTKSGRQTTALNLPPGTKSVAVDLQLDLAKRPIHCVERLSGSTAVAPSKATELTKVANRAKSAYELRVKYKNKVSESSKMLEVRRKPLAVNNLLEDITIMDISAGPYATERAGSTNQENLRPTDNRLPSLSSSEWLATSSRKREVKKASSLSPVLRTENSPSPVSPGQRMVTNWLDGRRCKESTPAFV